MNVFNNFAACIAEKSADGVKAEVGSGEGMKSKGKAAAKSTGRKTKSGPSPTNMVEGESCE